MLEANQGGDLERISEEFTPITLKTEENTYWKDYEYGGPIQKLRPGIEVAGSTGGLYATIEALGTQSIPNNTTTTITGLSTKSGNIAMTATSDQITITESGAYLLNAYCFAGFSTSVVFRIYKNGSTITPHYRESAPATSWGPNITTVEQLVVGDVLTIIFFQNSGSSQIIQNARLSAIKI